MRCVYVEQWVNKLFKGPNKSSCKLQLHEAIREGCQSGSTHTLSRGRGSHSDRPNKKPKVKYYAKPALHKTNRLFDEKFV